LLSERIVGYTKFPPLSQMERTDRKRILGPVCGAHFSRLPEFNRVALRSEINKANNGEEFPVRPTANSFSPGTALLWQHPGLS